MSAMLMVFALICIINGDYGWAFIWVVIACGVKS